MPLLTADEVDQQLEKLQGGASSPEALGDWARDMRMAREPESEAVGEVLARMQQLGRADHLPQDLSVLRGALRSRDAVGLLHRHFTGRTQATRNPEFEGTLLEQGRNAMDTLTRQHRAQRIVWYILLVPWILGALVLGRCLDDPDDLQGLELIFVAAYCAVLPAAAHILRRFMGEGSAPRCPLCGTAWDALPKVEYADLIGSRRCPRCRAQF